ncbi:C40 family peptidase [Niabella yanshanensis]|uniref:C40 family peptidase n=1 Tax=Niabella yanshanensis TaxID=577386 RepID=A0ABZ0WCD4_9BACT|nr:C40 family peptidase [Niabella yanshanensis]WQD40364.1 C40 family peptidase [Niabella yanshanensis]
MKAVYAIVTVPAAPVRKAPNHRREMSNQLFFGEPVQITGQKDNQWLKVKSLYDGYTGWLTPHLVKGIDAATAMQESPFLASQFLTKIELANQLMQVPLGSTLPDFKKKEGVIAGIPYSCATQAINTATIKNKQAQLLENAHQWLNAPYLWGGKTILGVDCSGFAQTQYKLVGLPILRDAWEQALQGRPVPSLKKVQPADLAFFEDKGKIVHVGILLDSTTIIHAAGKVRIDPIDNKGIVNSDTGMRTHQLKCIRRFIE